MKAMKVMASDKCNLPPAHRKGLNHIRNSLPRHAGIKWADESQLVKKRIDLNLLTLTDLRAAYLFKYKEGSVESHMFEPSHDPLSTKEVKGHMAFAINAIQAGQLNTTALIKTKHNRYIRKRSEIKKCFGQLSDNDSFYAILVFSNVIYAGGNHFDISTLCNMIVNHKESKSLNKYKWPEPDRFNRLIKKDEPYSSFVIKPHAIKRQSVI